MQNKVLMSIIYSESLGRINLDLLKTSIMSEWFGVDSDRVFKLVDLALRLGGKGYKADEHGMKQYAEEHRPTNSTPGR